RPARALRRGGSAPGVVVSRRERRGPADPGRHVVGPSIDETDRDADHEDGLPAPIVADGASSAQPPSGSCPTPARITPWAAEGSRDRSGLRPCWAAELIPEMARAGVGNF